jgi:hypothetical protein
LATRAAALTHAVVALLAHVAGRPLWSARRGDGDTDRRGGGREKKDTDTRGRGKKDASAAADPAASPSEAHHPQRPGVAAAAVWALVSLSYGTAMWTAVAVCFGVGAIRKLRDTAHLSLLLASLTAVPGAAMYGCAPAARWEWHRVLVLGGGAFHPMDFVWFGGAWGTGFTGLRLRVKGLGFRV